MKLTVDQMYRVGNESEDLFQNKNIDELYFILGYLEQTIQYRENKLKQRK